MISTSIHTQERMHTHTHTHRWPGSVAKREQEGFSCVRVGVRHCTRSTGDKGDVAGVRAREGELCLVAYECDRSAGSAPVLHRDHCHGRCHRLVLARGSGADFDPALTATSTRMRAHVHKNTSVITRTHARARARARTHTHTHTQVVVRVVRIARVFRLLKLGKNQQGLEILQVAPSARAVAQGRSVHACKISRRHAPECSVRAVRTRLHARVCTSRKRRICVRRRRSARAAFSSFPSATSSSSCRCVQRRLRCRRAESFSGC